MNWVFFPLMLSHTSCILYLLIFHMARSTEVQEGCNTLQLCDWCPKGTAGSTRSSRRKRLSHHLSKPATSIVSATVISTHPELLHIQSISVFSSTSYFQNNFCLELEHSERPMSMLFFLTRGKRKVAFRQFIKFCLDQRTSLLCCAKPQCQLSVRYQKII